ncbi:hypothetical protein U879_00930 [Defluviimonas sp. 20V17]|nr:hypothetical protein U879_00930 [Defluviimonas sp. 20V17]
MFFWEFLRRGNRAAPRSAEVAASIGAVSDRGFRKSCDLPLAMPGWQG